VYHGGALTLSVDAFNVLDKRTVLQRDVTRLNNNNAGGTFGSSNHITELQSPRVFRLGARVTF
jgi:outer membrane receptor protein involved in Fe transport